VRSLQSWSPFSSGYATGWSRWLRVTAASRTGRPSGRSTPLRGRIGERGV